MLVKDTAAGVIQQLESFTAKYFTDNFPARSTIQVAGLPKAANVEIEVIAHF